jgi:hypothetical protein
MRLAPHTCPACRTTLNAATFVSREKTKPDEGDYSVCIKCGALLRFTDNLSLRFAEDAELENFKAAQPREFHTLITASLIIARRRTTRA